MWLHQVEVVKGSGHIPADRDNVVILNWSPFQLCSQAGCHQLSENDRLSFKRCSNKLDHVRMAN